MDGGPKDAPQAPQPPVEQTPADRIRTEFEVLPPAQRREVARSLFYSAYELPQGWTEWLDNQLVTPAKQAFGDNKSDEPSPSQVSPEQNTNLEDEIAAAIKNISFFSTFPNGLVIAENELTSPRDRDYGYKDYAPDNWSFTNLKSRANDLILLFGIAGTNMQPIPETAIVTEEPNPDNPENTVISFGFNIDRSIKDHAGRPVNIIIISLNLLTSEAKKLLHEIKQRPDGADFSERFLQKALPGALDGDLDKPGIKRARTTGLVVLDEDTLRGFFSGPEQILQASRSFGARKQFQQYVKQNLEIRQYSSPVGMQPAQTT